MQNLWGKAEIRFGVYTVRGITQIVPPKHSGKVIYVLAGAQVSWLTPPTLGPGLRQSATQTDATPPSSPKDGVLTAADPQVLPTEMKSHMNSSD